MIQLISCLSSLNVLNKKNHTLKTKLIMFIDERYLFVKRKKKNKSLTSTARVCPAELARTWKSLVSAGAD